VTARLRPWLISVVAVVVIALAVLVMFAVWNVGHDMHHLDYLAGKAFKGD
jgi:hypothetical protein